MGSWRSVEALCELKLLTKRFDREKKTHTNTHRAWPQVQDSVTSVFPCVFLSRRVLLCLCASLPGGRD